MGLVHRDDPERWYGEGGGRGVQGWELMYTCGGFLSMYGKTNTVLQSKKKKKFKVHTKYIYKCIKSICTSWTHTVLYLSCMTVINKNIYRVENLREGSFRELQRTSEGPLEPSPVFRPVLCCKETTWGQGGERHPEDSEGTIRTVWTLT